MTNHTAQLKQSGSGRAERAAAYAAEYDALQGYAWMALGAGLVLGGVIGPVAVWAALGAAMSAVVPSGYHRRYGFARATRVRNARVLLGTLVVVLLLAAGWVVDGVVQPPVSVTVLAVAVALAGGQHLMLRRTGLTLVHHLVHVLVALAALAPLAGFRMGSDPLPFALTVGGVALLVTGLVDHRRLVALLGPVAEEPRA